MKVNFNEEKKLWKHGYNFVVGLDESGRGCEKPDAEVLTNNGWKFYNDINLLTDKVLSYTNDGCMVWQRIDKIIEKDFNSNLIELKNRGINIIVTPDHYFNVLRRVFKRDKKDGNRLKLVGYTMRSERKIVTDLDNNDFIPRGGTWIGKYKKKFFVPAGDKLKGKNIDIKIWMAFLGIFLSGGSIYHDKNRGSYRITISQSVKSSPRKYKKILELLKNLPFHFNDLKDGFNCYSKQLYYCLLNLGNKYTKFIPEKFKNLEPHLLNILIDWMLLGDGSYYIGKNRKKVSVYYTASNKLRDDFEEILLKAGWTYHTVKRPLRERHINGRLIKKENQKGCFEIRLRRNNKAIVKHLHKKEIPYKGKVFCLQLPKYHNFYVRRNGTGYFTGNSLCGPVVAAAVLIDKNFKIRNFGIRDSKKLNEKQREFLYQKLTSHKKIKWGTGIVSERMIDRINIFNATKLAMRKAIKDLYHKSNGRKSYGITDFLLIDGNFALNNVNIPQKSIIAADQKVFSCAAAGIIAKVTRDKIMQKLHQKYPQYGFDTHKGYGTKLHIKNLKKFGLCAVHRKTFMPVRNIVKV